MPTPQSSPVTDPKLAHMASQEAQTPQVVGMVRHDDNDTLYLSRKGPAIFKSKETKRHRWMVLRDTVGKDKAQAPMLPVMSHGGPATGFWGVRQLCLSYNLIGMICYNTICTTV